MKTGVAITLIIVGGMLILGPLVADYFNQSQHQANAMRVVERSNDSVANKLSYLRDRYPMDPYAYLCLAAGVAMAVVGTRGAVKSPHVTPPNPTPTPASSRSIRPTTTPSAGW